MKRITWVLVLFLAGPCVFAQTYGRLDLSLQTAQGQAVPNATVNIYSQVACGTASTGSLATLYPTATGGTPITQPLITNGYGASFAYVPQGCYTVSYFSTYTGTQTFMDQVPQNASGAVAPGTAGQLCYYATDGNTCSGLNVGSGLTINMGTITASGTPLSLLTNSVSNGSQSALNFETSTTNSDGLTVTPYNSTSVEKMEITGTYSGSISSSQVTAALGYTPANCTPGTTGSDCLQLSAGLVPSANLPQSTVSVFGAVKPDGTTITASGGVLSAVGFLYPIVARTFFTSCTLGDDGAGGSGCTATQSWGVTISGTYYLWCNVGSLAISCGNLADCSGVIFNETSHTSTDFTYILNQRVNNGRTNTVSMQCWATN